MSLPNLLNTNHLRTLSLGINTSRFLEYLIPCIAFIENLSVGVKDIEINEYDWFKINSLPVAVDPDLLLYLSRLHIDCKNSITCRRTIALLSSVFGQLRHLSLKLVAYISIYNPLIISADTIQELCVNRLKPLATYGLNLEIDVEGDLKEKIIFNSFVNIPFSNRQQPRVFIQERRNFYLNSDYHCFTNSGKISFCPMPINAAHLFPRANELFLTGHRRETCISELANFRSSISSFVPCPLLTKISIDEGDIVTTAELESILRMAYNVHTLEIREDMGIFPRAILHNIDNLGTRVNQQIQTLVMDDRTLTFQNAEQFCRLLSNQLPNLKKVSLGIYKLFGDRTSRASCIVDGENESTKSILNVVYFLVDHLQQLVLLYIDLNEFARSETLFPHIDQAINLSRISDQLAGLSEFEYIQSV